MAASITKTQRWLDLIAYLVGRHRPVAVAELMERLPAYRGYENAASAARVFERDKDELRALGIPLETVRYRTSHGHEEETGYALAAGDFYLPYLKLVEGLEAPREEARRREPGRLALSPEDAGEVLAALRTAAERPDVPLAREARSAYAKLAFGVEDAAPAPPPLLYLEERGEGERRQTLERLSDCLLARQRVRFRYHALGRDEWSEREVAPLGLFSTGGGWYLVAHDEGRAAVRVFHVGRMQALAPSGGAQAYAPPEGFRLAAYAHRPAWELGDDEPLDAVVRFRFPGSLWAERNAHGELLVREDGGAVLRRFPVRQPGSFLRWLLSLEVEAELLEPTPLVEAYHRLVERTLRLYAGRRADA